jgi:hypothetical protein
MVFKSLAMRMWNSIIFLTTRRVKMKLGGFKTYNVHFQCNHMAMLRIVGDKK